jgi:hypothetical protein
VSEWLLGEASGATAADTIDGHPGMYVDGSNEGLPDAQMNTGYSPNTSTPFYIGMGSILRDCRRHCGSWSNGPMST